MDGGRPRGRGRKSGAGASSPSQPTSSIPRPPRDFSAQEPVRTIPGDMLTKVGKAGLPIRLYANYFRINTPEDLIIYDYHIIFEPPVESVRARRQLIYQCRERFGNCYIYDGGSNVKSQLSFETPAIIYGDGVQVHILFTGEIAWRHPEMMRFYNIQMRRNLEHIGMIQMGRHYYNPSGAITLESDAMEIWPGMLTAVNEHDGGILMVVNSLHKIVRHETAYDMLKRLNISIQNRTIFRENARRQVAGLIVMTTYNKKTYRVDDVMFDTNPVDYNFEGQEGPISLKDYYLNTYLITIKDETQPLLVVSPTDRQRRGGMTTPVILVPELCLLTGITETMKNDMRLRKDIETHVKLSPPEKMQSLTVFAEKMTNDEDVINEMGQWGITIDTDLVRVTGRVLPAEKILMADQRGENDGIAYNQISGSFEKNIRSKRMIKPVTLEFWVVIATHRDRNSIETYVDTLREIASALGITLSPPKFNWIDNDRIPSYINSFQSIPMEQAKLINVIVPNNNRDRYCAIKRYFTIDQPCPSQVITRRVLDKISKSIATKILIQMSVKMGAQPWGVFIPPKKAMIVGFNTYRDTSKRGHSVGAFVSSTNYETTSWFSRADYYRSSQEMSSNFANHLKHGLKVWHIENKSWPERIIIYRDGVSEGQIGYIYETEIRNVIELLAEKDDLKRTLWSFIIVNKRVNARFFCSRNIKDPVINPVPGTIVDSIVTRKERYDFYLVSQSVREGTVNPTMYNIIRDNTRWDPAMHQIFAYKMCHLYYNWAGTVSVPAPCLYAYKLAFLIGTCIHTEPNPRLAGKLYYL